MFAKWSRNFLQETGRIWSNVFYCSCKSSCSPTWPITFFTRQGSSFVFPVRLFLFSHILSNFCFKELIPFLEAHWDALTTQPKRTKQTWHLSITKSLVWFYFNNLFLIFSSYIFFLILLLPRLTCTDPRR